MRLSGLTAAAFLLEKACKKTSFTKIPLVPLTASFTERTERYKASRIGTLVTKLIKTVHSSVFGVFLRGFEASSGR